jgi:GTPase SAR1 family protein
LSFYNVDDNISLKAGNKIDLREDPETINKLKNRGQSPITTEQGRQLAKEIGAVAYIENRFNFIEKSDFTSLFNK